MSAPSRKAYFCVELARKVTETLAEMAEQPEQPEERIAEAYESGHAAGMTDAADSRYESVADKVNVAHRDGYCEGWNDALQWVADQTQIQKK